MNYMKLNLISILSTNIFFNLNTKFLSDKYLEFWEFFYFDSGCHEQWKRLWKRKQIHPKVKGWRFDGIRHRVRNLVRWGISFCVRRVGRSLLGWGVRYERWEAGRKVSFVGRGLLRLICGMQIWWRGQWFWNGARVWEREMVESKWNGE